MDGLFWMLLGGLIGFGVLYVTIYFAVNTAVLAALRQHRREASKNTR